MDTIYDKLKAFGTDRPSAWTDLANINRLCDRCQTAEWEATRLYLLIGEGEGFCPKVPIYNRPPTVEEIRSAAHNGCHLCSLLLAVLLTVRYRASIGVDPIPDGLETVCDSTQVNVDVEVMPGQKDPIALTVTIVCGTERCLEYSLSIVSSLPVDENLVCMSSAVDIARMWLNDCSTSHKMCHSDLPELPKRVIDVSGELLHVREFQTRAEYATLSYSIGQVELLTSTSTNLEDRKRGFMLQDLPLTVRDAVWWTRQLGIRYLWIDSLCILQDSLTDWELELSTMSNIYRNSTLTIAATASRDASQGCQPNRNKLTMIACRIAKDISILPDFRRSAWLFRVGPLESRGWTFQEVQLAQRVIRVGGEELGWQCRACTRIETVPKDEDMPWKDQRIQATRNGVRVLDIIDKLRQGRPFGAWYNLVQAYANRKLTVPSDKLPAFSGMARTFHEILGSTYVGGLWKEDVTRGLAWGMTYPGDEVAYRAPSWSWAAAEGGHFRYVGSQLAFAKADGVVAEMLDIRAMTQGHNPFGRVTSGKLVILGPLAPIPSQLYNDESEIVGQRWNKYYSWFWDRGLPGLSCFFLKLHETTYLLLQRQSNGVYIRVGYLGLPPKGQPNQMGEVLIGTLDSYDWETNVVSIV